MRLCWWDCVDDVVEMVLSWWWCVSWCSVDGVVWMVWALKKCLAIRNWDASSAAPAMQNEPEVLKLLHVPRKTSLRCSKFCACHAKWAGGAPSAAPATQKRGGAQKHHSSPDFRRPLWSVKVLQVLRLPRKTCPKCSKCCVCYAKRAWGCSKCCACHAKKRGGTQKHHSSPDFRRPLWRCSKCCACHAKRAWGAPSAAPATQNKLEVLQLLRLPRKTRRRPKASLVAGLLPTSQWRCSKCCACHARRAWGAPSAACATQSEPEVAPSAASAMQIEAAPKSITRRRTSADLYEGAPSAAPATQNEPEVLRVLHLPRKTSLKLCRWCCVDDVV